MSRLMGLRSVVTSWAPDVTEGVYERAAGRRVKLCCGARPLRAAQEVEWARQCTHGALFGLGTAENGDGISQIVRKSYN